MYPIILHHKLTKCYSYLSTYVKCTTIKEQNEINTPGSAI